MPKFFMFLGYWIGRFSDEEDRAHVHVLKFGSSEAMKVWLVPDVEVEYIKDISASTANKILAEIRRRKDDCIDKWNDIERKSR